MRNSCMFMAIVLLGCSQNSPGSTEGSAINGQSSALAGAAVGSTRLKPIRMATFGRPGARTMAEVLAERMGRQSSPTIPAPPTLEGGPGGVMTPDGMLHEVEIVDEAGFRASLEQAVALGATTPRKPERPPAPRLVPDARQDRQVDKSWSNGIDSRTPFTIASQGWWPFSPTGSVEFNGSQICSGTLVGRRHVLTAFHCYFDQDGNWLPFGSISFAPRREGAWRPYNSEPEYTKYWNWDWFNNNCNDPDVYITTLACNKWDWVLIVLEDQPTANNGAVPSWAGMQYDHTDATVSGWTTAHAGYPGCGGTDDPVTSCQTDTLYGHPPCSVGDFTQPLGGINSMFYMECDTSPGHSGGPVYRQEPGGLYVHAIWQSWNGGAPTGPRPNRSRRMTNTSSSDIWQWSLKAIADYP
jgi:V8-like Glu-specific endopeptidase